MGDDRDEAGLLDRAVDFLAGTLDSLGLNGTRLRWKWNQKRKQLSESGERAENIWRSAKSRHKMCPSCRALVPRGANTCEECGRSLADVAAPGLGRILANVLPGATAATSLILLANGFWFLMVLMAQIKSSDGDFGLFSGFSGLLLYRFGSGWSGDTMSGQWWRLITPIFLHGGIIHFFFNSYVLLQVGPLVEEEYGTERFWTMYLLCGISGSLLSHSVRLVNTVGASGALLGMIGLLLVYGWRTGGPRGEMLKSAMLRYLIYIALFSLFLGGAFSIDHLNHLGGLLCGAALGWAVPGGAFRDSRAKLLWDAAAIGGVLVVVYAFYKVATTTVL